MLKAIAQLAQRRNMDCQVCMEAYMACGIGICQSCVVAVRDRRSAASSKSVDDKKQYKLVCTNGPVFDAKTIIWEQTNSHQ
jgi:dihydroorotate dehydrogenase electron transfer subunit